MGFINRFFLLIGTLVLLAASIVLLACVLGIVPERLWLNEIRFALGRQETIAAAAVLLLVSLRLLTCVFSSGRNRETHRGEFVAVANSMGTVCVAVDAIRELVNRVVSSVSGVRETKSHITVRKEKDGDVVSVSLRLVIGQEANAAALSEAVSARVCKQLAQTMGLLDVPVRVEIVGITDAAPARKHRVA